MDTPQTFTFCSLKHVTERIYFLTFRNNGDITVTQLHQCKSNVSTNAFLVSHLLIQKEAPGSMGATVIIYNL